MSVLDSASCHRLHGYECDALFGTLLEKVFALAFNDIVGEHDGLDPIKLQRAFEHLERMCSYAKMANLALTLCIHKRLECSSRSKHGVQLLHARIMHLIEVDMVGMEIAKAYLYILCHSVLGARHALSREIEPVSLADEGVSYELFTDGIAPCGIDIVHAILYKRIDKRIRRLLVYPLYRNAAKSNLGNLHSGPSELYILHVDPPIMQTLLRI